MFDPILDQLGLGAETRDGLKATVTQVRTTIEGATPRIDKILASLEEAALDVRTIASTAKPAATELAGRIEEIAPRLQTTIEQIDTLLAHADGMLSENRENLRSTTASLRELTANTNALVLQTGPKIPPLLDGFNNSRMRLDRVLYHADVIGAQASSLLTQNSTDLQRTVTNVRDATDYARLLTQKILANPFLISPLYKPSREDVKAQANFDAMQQFVVGARELNDTVSRLQAMRARAGNGQDALALDGLIRQCHDVNTRMRSMVERMALELPVEDSRGVRRP
jgi:phospholipid/cholesterol/gamma-HCH transport system substrate-binding protein